MNIYVVWKDNRTGVMKVYMDKSTDRGVTFNSDKVVYEWNNDESYPGLPMTADIDTNNGLIYISWICFYSDSYYDSDILFAYSDDEGETFSTPIVLSPMEGDAIFTHPWLAVDENDTIYAVYVRRNDTNSEVFFTKSENNETSFTSPVRVNDFYTQNYCGGVQVVISKDGVIHIVWSDNRAGDGTQYIDIYYSSSDNGGSNFKANILVNDDTEIVAPNTSIHRHFTRGAQGTPTIITDNDSNVHIFWEDFRNYVIESGYCRDVYYAYSNDSESFSTNIKVNYIDPSSVSVNIADPNVAFDNQGNFVIVFSDSPSGDTDYPYIFLQSVKMNNPFTTSISITKTTPGFNFLAFFISSFSFVTITISKRRR